MPTKTPGVLAGTTQLPLTIKFGFFGVRVIRPSSLTIWLGPTLEKTFSISEGTGPVDINLGDNQECDITLQGLDAAGLVGQFVKPPVWTCDTPAVVKITPTANGAGCHVEAAIPATLGSAVVTVTDADDTTVAPLVFNVTVAAEAISHLGATISPPVDRPAPAPGP